MAEKYDLTVIGSGPGGYVAAIRAAQLGLKTVCIENNKVGGVCLNWGCIPTKALLFSARLFQEIKESKKFGILTEQVSVDFSRMVKHSRTTADRLSKGIEYLFRKNKVESIEGRGVLTSKTKVIITRDNKEIKEIETKNTIIATGARPRPLPGVDFDRKQIITSKEAMVLKDIPGSLVIIGAGAIGVEFAYLYASLGTKVTLVEMLPQILPIEDEEVVQVVTKSFKKQGIEILTETKVEKIEKQKSGVKVVLSGQDEQKEIKADLALVAIGVQGNIEDIGLEGVGINAEKGAIPVNKETFQTDVDNIYAIGDVIGQPWLAHVASQEGIVAVEKIAGRDPFSIDYNFIPSCTYCQPQVASLGLKENQAREKGYDIKVGRFPFRANGKSLAMGQGKGFSKLIFDSKYGELLGAHIVGAEATEMLAELGVARTLETTADEIISTIHAHPTVSEVIKETTEQAFGKAIHI